MHKKSVKTAAVIGTMRWKEERKLEEDGGLNEGEEFEKDALQKLY